MAIKIKELLLYSPLAIMVGKNKYKKCIQQEKRRERE